ncbi:acyl-CoA dehydrogenase family protein [Pacificimonas flava]|uniref:Cyclohexane-1-carbonyl-CoA dehydrogenase n=1 Tax=Pacificimonas flava TaxID=1234595 RepID=M2S9F2_9SPHN|nr:acyl-CoA dehydrogenase family protein [Pacificimonas flava]EMD82020.1 Butyryl-CoA dehydrogenase [Pacificimonas flava]MBB5280418.1 acyl-CoA dehydrogenase [Pacificimonas flava]
MARQNGQVNEGMDAESFEAFLEQLDRWVRERLIPAEARTIEMNRVPDDVRQEMVDMGLFGITTPEAYGGAGMKTSQYIETMKRISYAAPAYRSLLSINVGMVTTALVKGGTDAQRQEWLPKLSGGTIAAFALTEPGSGSDSAGLTTTAVRDGDHYVLNGTKRYITNAPFADMVIVMARTSKENLPKNAHVSAFLVPVDAPGVTIGKPDEKMGQAGAQIADVILEDARIPAENLLGGEEGKGFQVAMQSLDNGRLSIAACSTAYAQRALDSGLKYATERKAFGEPISGFQLIQAMLADSKAEIYASECMIRDATAKADTGQRVSMEAACAKMFASEMCGRVVDRVVQIYGGAGYLKEYDAERFFRDARLYRIYEGTTQIQQLVIAKAMLREVGAL